MPNELLMRNSARLHIVVNGTPSKQLYPALNSLPSLHPIVNPTENCLGCLFSDCASASLVVCGALKVWEVITVFRLVLECFTFFPYECKVEVFRSCTVCVASGDHGMFAYALRFYKLLSIRF